MKEKTNERKKSFYILEPKGSKKEIWNILMLACFPYCSFYLPFRIAFYSKLEDQNNELVEFISYFVSFVFTLDIFVNFLTGYQRMDLKVEYSLKKIAKKYLMS